MYNLSIMLLINMFIYNIVYLIIKQLPINRELSALIQCNYIRHLFQH